VSREPHPASPSVRPATPPDLPAIGRLGAELVRTHHALDRARFMAPSAKTAEGYTSFMGSQLTRSDVVVLVAEEGGEVVGYCYAGIEGRDYMSLRGPAGVLHDLVVDPACRGRGVGGLLLDSMLRELAARGAPQVVLHTASPNHAARRLFARAGFRDTMVEMTRDLG
jgi:ribosomal protein S18 acetylase RimI-like enzyme